MTRAHAIISSLKLTRRQENERSRVGTTAFRLQRLSHRLFHDLLDGREGFS
jgi:hypothetical protein